MFHIRFIAINDFIDSFQKPESIDTILVPFKNLMNDEYARDTSIKIKTSLNGKKKRGEFIGAFPSYGYLKDPKDKHKLIIDEKAAEIVRKIFDWNVKEGMGKIAICHRLNDMGILNPTGHKKIELGQNYENSWIEEENYTWTPSTIRKILSNEIYIGNTVQGKRKTKSYKIHKVEVVPQEEWIRVENTHAPIIDKETFEKAQNITRRDTRVQKDGSLSMWAGMLKCKDCGRAMHKKYCKNAKGTIYEYYICSTYRKKSNQLCTKHTIKVKDLENAVLEVVKQQIDLQVNKKQLLQELNEYHTSKVKLQKNETIQQLKQAQKDEIKKITNLKRGLYEDWKNNNITKEEYIDYKQTYEQRIEQIKVNVKHLEEQKEKQEKTVKTKNQWIENFENNILELDRDVITELIDYIEICEEQKIKIHFKFTIENF